MTTPQSNVYGANSVVSRSGSNSRRAWTKSSSKLELAPVAVKPSSTPGSSGLTSWPSSGSGIPSVPYSPARSGP